MMLQGRLLAFFAVPFLTWAAAGCNSTFEESRGDVKTPHNTINIPKVAVLYNSKFLQHNTGPGHPERMERLTAAVNRIRSDKSLARGIEWPSFKPASIADIAAVHSMDYIRLVEKEVKDLAPDQTSKLSTGDTMISPGTWEAAVLAAGAGTAACNYIMQGQYTSAFALVRPPGHHATQNRGMGFCVFNSVAIAARYLQREHGLKRILIVDFDVHHGNGTQDIFYDDDSVFYFSVHQNPLYPGSGRPAETGKGRGSGFTLNVELPAGSDSDEALAALRNKLKPAMESFKPEFVLVSAGFDGHKADPLGGLQYTAGGYAGMAAELLNIANQHAAGRIVFMLEGGYGLENTADSVAAVISALQTVDAESHLLQN